MSGLKSIAALAAGLAAMVAVCTPASADIWWDTTSSYGKVTFQDSIGDMAVFKFDDGTLLFIDGIGKEEREGHMYDPGGNWLESWNGRFTGWWAWHGDTEMHCTEAKTDPYGKSTTSWGRLEILFSDLRTFTLWMGNCDEPLNDTVFGSKGT